ncbi:accessory gene regulator B family protein [Sedimentibacter hydroxybenzoicus DSM 7310]|uniref:Accessory gene regulator B family protein n=1 Tax=Sedimentibacter hydroxybenzoicus DSM 7310 TaxID=1123245 RepID=A0A974BLQ2_SEDHY|nr:accessory gene regulator B family protein [Sedimentibacter hydroxybenzoicus]NYB75002.1 accessory gene regulator B family protein [Sedimentibacter hydroxybenzoicus DSM 7310]
MYGVCEKATNLMVQNEIISSEDREIYAYGLRQGFILFINILTTLLIGFVFNKTTETIVFLAAYIPLRIYTGGYHARTQIGCYVFSIVMIISVLLAIEFIPWTNFICITISIVSALIIYILSPVEDMNKPLDAAEVKVYGKKARIILGLELGVLVLLMTFGMKSVVVSMVMSLAVLDFMLVLEIFIKNR